MGDEDVNFHGVVVALAIVIVVAGLIEIVRDFFISLFYDADPLAALAGQHQARASLAVYTMTAWVHAKTKSYGYASPYSARWAGP